MNYILDNKLTEEGVVQYSTDSGCKYLATISELENGSGLWTLEFIRLSGNPSISEVFKIMRTLTDACMDYVYEKNIRNAILFITGENDEIIQQKTKVFQRWLKNDWKIEYLSSDNINILGIKIPTYIFQKNCILIKR